MDEFLLSLIKRANPNGRGIVEIVQNRDKEFNARFKKVKIQQQIAAWAARMDAKQKNTFGLDYLMFHHQPMDHGMALMCQRYGMDCDQWPDTFNVKDFDRAIAWEQNGFIPKRVRLGQKMYLSFAGGSEMSDYREGQTGNHFFRSELTVPTNWAGTTVYALGDRRRATSWNDTIFRCVVAGTSAASEPTWGTTIGDETTDGSVTWQAEKIGPLKKGLWFALYTASPGETGGGTEVSAGGYGRIAHHPSDTNWTASVQNLGVGRNDNAIAIQYGTPTANWGVITDTAFLDRLTGGNLEMYTPIDAAKTINNGDTAPSFPIGGFNIDHA